MENAGTETALDGVTQPSTDPTRKMFSFDLIPTSVIDNIICKQDCNAGYEYKFCWWFCTNSDKDIPTEPFLIFQWAHPIMTLVHLRNSWAEKVRKYDYLAFDDGSKKPSNRTG